MKNSVSFLALSLGLFCAQNVFAANTIVESGGSGTGNWVADQPGLYNDFIPSGTIKRLAASKGAILTVDGNLNIVGVKGTPWNTIDIRDAGTDVTINGNLTSSFAPNNDRVSHGIYLVSGKLTINGDTKLTEGYGYESKQAKSALYNYGGTADINGNMDILINGNIFYPGGKGLMANNNALTEMKSTTGTPYLLSVTNNGSQRSVESQGGSLIDLDLVKLNGNSKISNGMGMFAYGKDSRIRFMGGEFNDNYSSIPAATAMWSQYQGNITATGYAGGSLTVNSSGNNEKAIWAFGNSQINLNSEKHADFVTNINTKPYNSANRGQNGISAGTLGMIGADGAIIDTPNVEVTAPDIDDPSGKAEIIIDSQSRVGSRWGLSEINAFGQTNINIESSSAYALSVMGDGNKIHLYGLDGQKRSQITAAGTAINFAFADGYALDTDDNKLHGGQEIIVEKADITHKGETYLTNGDLIQVGGSVPTGNDGQNTGIMKVPDAVINATLTLRESSATALDGHYLLNVRNGNYDGETKASSFTMNADNTVLTGHIITEEEPDSLTRAAGVSSTSTLNMTNNSVWYMTQNEDAANQGMNSNLTNLNVDRSSEVYLNSRESWINRSPNQPIVYNELITKTLSGNGSFYFHTDIENGATDRLIVTEPGGASGDHTVIVKNDASQNTDGSEVLHIVQTQGGDAKFALQGAVPVELGAYGYGLRRNADDENKWELFYLAPSSSAETFNTFLHTNYLLSYLDLETLMQRMGELRYSQPDNNVWIKGLAGRLNSFGPEMIHGYRMNYDGFQGGIDHTTDFAGGRLYGGVMGGLINGDQKFHYGKGSADNIQAGLYGGWLNKDGYYGDAVLKYARLKNKFNILDSQFETVTTSSRTNAYTASLELGKRFVDNGGWFLEPQLQAVYGHQQSFSATASNGLRVHFDDYNSLLLRGSALIGYEFHDTDSFSQVYFKTGYIREVLADDVGIQFNGGLRQKNDFSGGWWENALGVTTRFAENHNIYLEAGYKHGGMFDQYQGNLGYRYEF